MILAQCWLLWRRLVCSVRPANNINRTELALCDLQYYTTFDAGVVRRDHDHRLFWAIEFERPALTLILTLTAVGSSRSFHCVVCNNDRLDFSYRRCLWRRINLRCREKGRCALQGCGGGRVHRCSSGIGNGAIRDVSRKDAPRQFSSNFRPSPRLFCARREIAVDFFILRACPRGACRRFFSLVRVRLPLPSSARVLY